MAAAGTRVPRLGFLGTGWIGRHRMLAIRDSGLANIAGICDPSPQCLDKVLADVPQARAASSLDELLAMQLDGIVIATPSALHAEQSIAALNAGVAVFCQKPLGRNAAEAAAVVDAARAANRLLGLDLSYRHVGAMEKVSEHIAGIGPVFAADLVFHNAYGPDKPWFYDLQRSGGGCVIDLGVHLVDALLWTLDFPQVTGVTSRLFHDGKPLEQGQVEDYGVATLELSTGAVARLACSWRLHAGCDAQISATFHGTQGSLVFENTNGSFVDFRARLLNGTASQTLTEQPEDWGGCAAVRWTSRLARGETFDANEARRFVEVAAVLDRIYGR
jgi:predicted dehydrogenase